MRFLNLILFIFLFSTLNAKEIYTVDKLISLALQNSPDLKISLHNYEASQQRVKSASSLYYPDININLSGGKAGVSDIINNNNKMNDDEILLGNLSLSQIIYDFGKTGSNLDSLTYESDSYLMGKEQDISNKIKEVKTAYYKVLQTIAIIQVNKENIKLNEIQLYRSKKYFDAGIRTKIDITDAEVELIQAKIDLEKSEYDLKLAYAELDKVIGNKALQTDYVVFAKELDLFNLYQTLLPYDLSLEKSISYAYENRYELKKYNSLINSSMAKAEIASSEFYPSIYLNADTTKQKSSTVLNLPEDQWQASVNLNWNLYKGGATSAKEQEQKIQTQISLQNYEDIKLLIKNQTSQAFYNLYKIKNTVKLSQSLLKASQEKFHQAAKRYEHGLSDYIELQQSRQGYIDAMASLVISYYDYYNAMAILNNVIGK